MRNFSVKKPSDLFSTMSVELLTVQTIYMIQKGDRSLDLNPSFSNAESFVIPSWSNKNLPIGCYEVCLRNTLLYKNQYFFFFCSFLRLL